MSDGGGGITKPSDFDGILPQLIRKRLFTESADCIRWLFAADCPADATPRAVQPREDVAIRHAASVRSLSDIVKVLERVTEANVSTLR